MKNQNCIEVFQDTNTKAYLCRISFDEQGYENWDYKYPEKIDESGKGYFFLREDKQKYPDGFYKLCTLDEHDRKKTLFFLILLKYGKIKYKFPLAKH